jgi:hypothetical protein
MKITDIKLLSYDRDTNSTMYKDLLGETTKVLALKPRADPRDNETVAQRTARRAAISKTVSPPSTSTSDSPMAWQEATSLAVALVLFVLITFCAGVVMHKISLAIKTPAGKKSRR